MKRILIASLMMACFLMLFGCDSSALREERTFDSIDFHGLDIVQINVDPTTLDMLRTNEDPDQEVEVEVQWHGETYRAELELHGGFSRSVAKKSYRLKFKKSHRPMIDFDGEEIEVRRVVLQASWIDPTFMRNKLTFDLGRELGLMTPHATHLAVRFNREFPALFVAIERVDGDFLERRGSDGDGLLLKASSNDANWAKKYDSLLGLEQKGNDDARTDAFVTLLDKIDAANDFQSFEQDVATRLSLDDYFCHQMVNTFAMNRDTFMKNYYLYFDENKKGARFRIIQWDADATWGISWNGTRVVDEDLSWHNSNYDSEVLGPKLFAIDEYRHEYLKHYYEQLMKTFSASSIRERVERMRAKIEVAAEADIKSWRSDIDFNEEVHRLLSFSDVRGANMRKVLERVPKSHKIEPSGHILN